MYSIKTEVCGNPDFGQDPNKPPYGVKSTQLKAKNFEDLKTKVRKWMYVNDIGGGNWQDPPLLVDGEVVGYMSYNGKVWADRSWTPETRQIYFYKENQDV